MKKATDSPLLAGRKVDDAVAANDDAIENAGRPAGWDPFEVWRTRVKAVRDQQGAAKEDGKR